MDTSCEEKKFSLKGNFADKDEELLQSLPKQKGWGAYDLLLFQNHWIPPRYLKATITFLKHFQANPSDIIVASLPKSGTTWLKALAFAISKRNRSIPISQNDDHPLRHSNPHSIVPFLETIDLYGNDPNNVIFPHLSTLSEPRLFALEEAFEKYIEGIFDYGPFWSHMLGYWKASKDTPNKVLFLKYDELKANTNFEVKRMAQFLDCTFSEEEESGGVIDAIIELCSFGKMKELEQARDTSCEEKKFSLKANFADEDEELLQSLPKQKGWGAYDLLLFQNHWIPPLYLKATITFLKHFQAKPSDIIVASLPKSGTTWLKALAFAISKRNRSIPIFQNDDHPLRHSNPHSLVPFLETIDLYGNDPNNVIFPHLSTLFEPRLFALEEAFEKYIEGIFDYGPFWSHMLGYWKASKDTPNKVLFLKYDELKANTNFEVKRMAQFLDCTFSEEEESGGVIDAIVELCSFGKMKELEQAMDTSCEEKKFSLKGNFADEDEELLQSLPKQKGWGAYDLLLFQNHWIPPLYLKATITFLKHFQAKPSDIIVASLPKSGTTWLKALAFAISKRNRSIPISQNDDHLLRHSNPHSIVPFLETIDLYGNDPNNVIFPHLSTLSEPRLFALEEAFEKYIEGIFDYGPFWSHMLGYWKASKDTPNKVLFLKYDELKANTNFEVKRMAQFLDCTFSEEEESGGVIDAIIELCSFGKMKELEQAMDTSCEEKKFSLKANFADEDEELLQSLPKQKGWGAYDLLLFQNHWIPPLYLKATITFLKHFQAKPSDIIVASLPKSGTTWLKALAFAISKCNRSIPIFQNDDHPLRHSNPHSLVPFLETIDLYRNDPNNVIFPHLSNLSEPRLFGTHIPFPLLPGSIQNSNCKIIYICRNPFDAFISLWHFKNNILSSQPLLPALALEEAFEKYIEGIFDYGPFWSHMLGYWKASKDTPNKVLFLKYDELKANTNFEVKRMAQFLDCTFSEEEESGGVIDAIVELCSFGKMKELEQAMDTSCQEKKFSLKANVADKDEELLQSLPKQKGWGAYDLLLFQNHLIPPLYLKATITFLKHFQAKPSDIIVASLPKSGTTWLKALAFAISKRNPSIPISQNDDHPLRHSNPHSLVPFLETMDLYGNDPNNVIFPHLSFYPF
ncbi:cytosolic sulfotransferase 15-like [Senna tora]|uniref:Cytosolic sulfotransferase 15-like n=1 Tax=Senna tora TaxID=362788 RepID=A0A834XHS7_9FABA|nr:cytosolic sulfotransferase 15-like [Senna tora]